MQGNLRQDEREFADLCEADDSDSQGRSRGIPEQTNDCEPDSKLPATIDKCYA